MPKKYIFIGDIHGCYQELVELLTKIAPTADDVVISLGDFLDRGPYPEKCLRLWEENNYLAVLGNHDQRLLDWYMGLEVPTAEGFAETKDKLINNKGLIEYLTTFPYLMYFQDISSVAVHAALDVNNQNKLISYENHSKEILLRGRYTRASKSGFKYVDLGKEKPGDKLWVEHWDKNVKVFYGHTPTQNGKPLVRNQTIGLDTGCAYGLNLTAAIVTQSHDIDFVSVKANRSYWKKANNQEIIII